LLSLVSAILPTPTRFSGEDREARYPWYYDKESFRKFAQSFHIENTPLNIALQVSLRNFIAVRREAGKSPNTIYDETQE
jgi:hypothetical protein